jgi:isoleucyl-tRNA synthetase
VSPVLCFTAEEVWQSRYSSAGSVHLETWPEIDAGWRDDDLAANWEAIRNVRTRVTEAIEPLRREKVIGSSLEAKVSLTLADEEAAAAIASVDFSEICIVSELGADRGDADAIAIARTERDKCGRCWRYLPEVNEDGALCARCDGVVNGR